MGEKMKTFMISTYIGDFNRLPKEVLNNLQEHGGLIYPDYRMTVIKGYNGDELCTNRCDYVAFCVHHRDTPHLMNYPMNLLPLVMVFKINKESAPELIIDSTDSNLSIETLSEVMNCNKYIEMYIPQYVLSYNIHVLDDTVYLDAVGIDEEFRVNYVHNCIYRFGYDSPSTVTFDTPNINNILSASHNIDFVLEKVNMNH